MRVPTAVQSHFYPENFSGAPTGEPKQPLSQNGAKSKRHAHVNSSAVTFMPKLLCPYLGERKRLVDKLVREFPDVFAFPRMTTTRQPSEHGWYALSGGELEEHQEELAALQEAQEHAGGVS